MLIYPCLSGIICKNEGSMSSHPCVASLSMRIHPLFLLSRLFLRNTLHFFRKVFFRVFAMAEVQWRNIGLIDLGRFLI